MKGGCCVYGSRQGLPMFTLSVPHFSFNLPETRIYIVRLLGASL